MAQQKEEKGKVEQKKSEDQKAQTNAKPDLEGCAKPFVAESHRMDEDDDACHDGIN